MSKIIIVDDSRDLLEVLKFFLEEKGYEIETVTTQRDLVSVIKSFLPDLIILDIYLQGQDGREICKELRRHAETKYMCILMFSASAKALVNYKEYGADGYIEKPFGLNEIVNKIEATLETCKDYYQQE
ncbi:MAG: response regulator receiver [Chitinophagaceae bacterium]|nr:response regulator receiver [Chitinophagaceae bacterium]